MRTLYQEPITRLILNLVADRDSADEIALYLAHLGFRGIKGHACADPIVNFLTQSFPELRWTVHVDHITAQDDQYNRLSVQTPDLLADFIVGFDQGEYPGLVKDGVPVRMAPTVTDNYYV